MARSALARARLSAEQIDDFNRDGCLLLRSCVPVDLIEQVREATDEVERQAERRLAEAGGRSGISESGAITFSAHLVAETEVHRRFATYELFPELAIDLIGPDVNLYWDQLVYKKPEKPRRFPWHQDNGYAFIVPQHYLTCWIPLVEATPDNGCPHLALGSHRRGTLMHEYVDPLGWQCFDQPPNGSMVAASSPGDVVVFSSLSPHLTGPNLTRTVRKTYILQYASAGSVVLQGDPKAGAPTGQLPVVDPTYQFPVARLGRPVT